MVLERLIYFHMLSSWGASVPTPRLRGQVFVVEPQPQSQATEPAVFAVAEKTEAEVQGVVKPSKAPETSQLPRREKALSCK